MTSPAKYFATFNQFFIPWQFSGFDHSKRPFQAAEALHAWLGEFPKDAADIQRLALGAAYTSNSARRPDVTAAMAAIGREASIMRPMATDEDVASAALLAFLEGNARIESGERNRDMSLFDESQWLSGKLGEESPFRKYLDLHQHTIAGRIAASWLESEIASEHLWRAIQAAEPLMHDPDAFRDLASHWQAITWGDVSKVLPNADELIAGLLKWDIRLTYWRAAAALGSACGAQSAEAARKCLEICCELGCLEAPAFLLRPAILGVPADERSATIDALRARLPDDASATSWQLLLQTCAARGLLLDGDCEGALALADGLEDRIEACHDAPTVAIALADRLLIDSATRDSSGERNLKTHEIFQKGAGALKGSPYLLQYKAIFDEHFSDAVRLAVQNLEVDDSDEAKLSVSVLIDTIRNPEAIELPVNREPGSIGYGLANASNLLGRIEVALNHWPGMAVIITQSVHDDTLFVTCRSGETFNVDWAGADYRRAARDLAKQQAIQLTGRRHKTDRLREKGAEACAALPDRVRQVIRDCECLVIVPDLAAEAAGVPYELFHDGHEALGIRKSIARAQSLARLVQLLEPPVMQPAFRYWSATVAVPEAERLPPLAYAQAEVLHAAKFFKMRGWECPDVDSDDLTGQDLLDTFELADYVHIAAHGEFGVGGTGIVLARGQRLSLTDIESAHRFLHAGVFLNTCSLGQAEYLGAGMSRGVANALGRSGAPFVIANLLPVQDLEAARIARDFYEYVAEHSVGKALALARKAAAQRGAPPTVWGSVILVGNPAFIVPSGKATAQKDVVTDLLSTYVDVEATNQQRGATYASARQKQLTTNHDPRLCAALCWVDHAARLRPPYSDRRDLDSAASLAAALNHPEGEALLRYETARHFKESETLRSAADALMRVASHRDKWRPVRDQILADLNRLDTPSELTVKAGGLSVNDMSDPAVAEAWKRIRAHDQSEIQRIGTVEVRRPETGLQTIAWNAVVLGKHGRFDGPFAALAFSGYFVEKLISAGHIDASSKKHAQRIFASLLHYLWTTQRRHHLEPDRAALQAAALRVAIDRVSKYWNPSSLPDEHAALETVESAARAWLEDESDASANALRTAVNHAISGLDDTWKDAAADGTAWLMGFIEELRMQVALREATQSHALLTELQRHIDKDADRRFDYYRQIGSQSLRSHPNHFLEQWRRQASG